MRTIVSINAIRTDPRCQSRAGIDPGLVHEYGEHIREGAALPPLSTITDDGEYYLYDGFHRLAAYREAGATAVDVEAVPGDIWDAIERSCAVNTTHGKRRTPADTKRAVETILKVMEHRGVRWSHQEIADRCAISRPRVTQLLPELSCKYLQDSVPTTVSRNGTTFEMNTSNIGKRSEPVVLDPGPDLGDDDVDDDDPEVPYEVVDLSSGEITPRSNQHHSMTFPAMPTPTFAHSGMAEIEISYEGESFARFTFRMDDVDRVCEGLATLIRGEPVSAKGQAA